MFKSLTLMLTHRKDKQLIKYKIFVILKLMTKLILTNLYRLSNLHPISTRDKYYAKVRLDSW